MKKINSLLNFGFLVLLCFNVSAQDVQLDKKTGLVKVDGKEAFYLIEKNKSFLSSDYSLQNLTGEELAYLKMVGEDRYNTTTQQNSRYVFYTITFSKSGNYCDLRDASSMSYMKWLAKSIAGANIVVNNAVSEEAERKFIVMHNGVFFNNPSNSGKDVTVNVNLNKDETKPAVAAAGPAEIVLKENKIYNHSEQIGVFKNVSDSAVMKLNIYKGDGSKIAYATHTQRDDNADWSVQILASNQTLTLLYDPSNPLEKLFKYMVEKGYFN